MPDRLDPIKEGLSFSEGIEHVLVLGTAVVRDGETVEGVYPGQPVLGRYLDSDDRVRG